MDLREGPAVGRTDGREARLAVGWRRNATSLCFSSFVLTFLFRVAPYQLRASLAHRQLMTFSVIGIFPVELRLSQSLLIRWMAEKALTRASSTAETVPWSRSALTATRVALQSHSHTQHLYLGRAAPAHRPPARQRPRLAASIGESAGSRHPQDMPVVAAHL